MSLARQIMVPLVLLLAACSGASTPPAGGGGGPSALDAGARSATVGGPLDGPLSAAQPLNGGFPAPSLEGDPGHDVTSLNFIDRSAACRESDPNVYSFHFEAMVSPAVRYWDISGRVVRLVDMARKTYQDTELQDKGGPAKKDALISLNQTGYLDLRFSAAYPLQIKVYLLPEDASKVGLGKSLPCGSESCAPETSIEVKADFMDGFDASKLSEVPSCAIIYLQENSSQPRFIPRD